MVCSLSNKSRTLSIVWEEVTNLLKINKIIKHKNFYFFYQFEVKASETLFKTNFI